MRLLRGDRGRPPAPPELRLLRRTRWRLIAWSGGTTLVALVLLGGAIYWAVGTSLESVGVAQLQLRAGQLLANAMAAPAGVDGGPGGTGGAAQLAPDPGLPGVVFGGSSSGTLGYVVRVSGEASSSASPSQDRAAQPAEPTSPGGPVVIRQTIGAGLIARVSLDQAGFSAARSGQTSVLTTTIGGTPVRILSEPVIGSGKTYLVQVVGDRTAEVNTLRILLVVLTGGGLLILALSLGVGYVYSGRALVPIRESLRRQREFAADASHELRTPLAVMRASVEDLQRHAESPAASVGTALRDLDSESTRLAGLVDQLLLLARADGGGLEVDRRAIDLSEPVVEAAEGAQPFAMRAGIHVELDLQPVPMTGDPERLRQLTALLLDNAVRHSPPGGTVHLRTRESGRTATLEVDDEGPGIPAADLTRIFDRFYRGASSPPGGSGLGLAIARWIVTRHGGTIEAVNLSGGGARFIARLPTGTATRPPRTLEHRP